MNVWREWMVLRVVGVVPPRPEVVDSGGSYSVTLCLSRVMSKFEVQAFGLSDRVRIVGDRLTVLSTSLEEVAAEAELWSDRVRRCVADGRVLRDAATSEIPQLGERVRRVAELEVQAAAIKFD